MPNNLIDIIDPDHLKTNLFKFLAALSVSGGNPPNWSAIFQFPMKRIFGVQFD